MSPVDWSRLYKYRSGIKNRFEEIWALPIMPRYSDVLLGEKIDPSALLEVGAGDRGLKRKIAKRWPDCQYASFDIDRTGDHDFFTLDEIKGEYDIVCMFEVIEHVSPELALDILNKAYDVLSPGGLLMITTPNIYYPPGYLRDVTHVTPWCYDELGGVTEMAGFEVLKLYRLYKESVLKQLVRRYLGYPFFRLVRIDYAKQIMLVASKPAG